jgi:outer membrane beta-barrel protein
VTATARAAGIESRPRAPEPERSSAEGPSAEVVAIVRRPVLKAHRFELGVTAGASLNQLFVTHYSLRLEGRYHASESISVGLEGVSSRSERNGRGLLVERAYGQSGVGNPLYAATGATLSYVFGYGKCVLGRRQIRYWEPNATLGAGLLQYGVGMREDGAAIVSALSPYMSGALGFTVFLGRAAAVNVGLRDYVYYGHGEPRVDDASVDPAISATQASVGLIHNIEISLGLSLFIPLSFAYRQPR